jgi:hypothetical protein
MSSELEHFPVRLNRGGFPNRFGSDSRSWPAKEAGVAWPAPCPPAGRVGAIEGGLSCGAEAQRFGVSGRAPVPHGHWKTTTFTAGLRDDGVAAPTVLDGPMNGEAILASVELGARGQGPLLRLRRDAAFSPTTPSHARKTAHAGDRDRSDILKRGEAWFEEQLDLGPNVSYLSMRSSPRPATD